VAERGQQPAQDFGLDQVLQRQALHGEQGVEGVPGALQGGEPQADGGPEHDPVAHAVAGQPPGQQPQGGQLDRLLDQPHTQVGGHRRLGEEGRLQDRGAKDPEHPAVDEGGKIRWVVTTWSARPKA
jgi:hypothetical protein